MMGWAMADLGVSQHGTSAVGGPAAVWRNLSGTRAYDFFIRGSVALWFLLLGIIFVRDIVGAVDDIRASGLEVLGLAQLVSRVCLFSFFTLIAWLTLVRARPLAQAEGLQPRLSALLGCYLLYAFAFLTPNPNIGAAFHIVSAVLLLIGNVLAVMILLRLGRSFSIMAEARRLVTDGPYAIVRHPLYLAELIATIGAFIQFASPPAALLVVAQLGFQVLRMRNEERVLLGSFPDYAAYKERTARLIPGIW
jgi:protein-S-isoprenylcysteine O-methyltransferase Ste14